MRRAALEQNAKRRSSDLRFWQKSRGRTSSCGDMSIFTEPSVPAAVGEEIRRRKIKLQIVTVTKNLLLASKM